MQTASPRPPIPPVTSATRDIVMPSSRSFLYRTFPDVSARCRFDRLVFGVTRFARCPLFSGQRFKPGGPIGPPASLLFFCRRQPALGIGLHIFIHPIAA